MTGSLEDCLDVVKDVLPKANKAPYPVAQKNELDVNLLVNTDLIGQILGKGGSKIKEIREQTNSKIKVYQDCLPNSNERVVAVGGDEETQVVEALRVILNILKDVPRRSIPSHYNPVNKQSDITGNGVGNVENAWRSDRRGNDDYQSDFLSVETETKITVTNDMCGAIIGKGGSRVSEIRNISGARITFSESERESKEDRVITITGTQRQVQAAEQLMTQSV